MALLSPTQIARELLAPSKKWHVIHIGGSRLTAKQKFVCTYSGLAWGGAQPVSMQPFDSTGHESHWDVLTGGVATENAYIEGDAANAIATTVYNTTVFSGEAEPDSTFAQMAYGSLLLTEYPLVQARLAANGGGALVRSIYRKHADCIVGGDGVRLEFVEQTAPETVIASTTITDATGSGLAVAEVEVPAGFDWLARPNVYLRWRATPGGSNPDGSLFQWGDHPWIESTGPCLVYHTEALNGGRWSWWVDTDFCPLSRWSVYHTLYGSDLILWSGIGANSWGETVEQNVADLTEIITRFRAANPDGPVVIDTQYPARSTADRLCTWREAAFFVAAAIPGVLVLDTYGLHDFEWWLAQGWLDDGVHASDDGVAQYMTDIGSLVERVAGGSGMATHSDDVRGDYCDALIARVDAGDGPGKLKIRDGTTVVATITLDDPCGTVSGGVLTFAGFPKTDLACDNAGTPDNAIVTDSDDNVILTLTAGIADAEVLLAKATYAAGEPLKIDSASYTAPV